MSLILSIILLVVGFFLLIKGADYFVEGCASVAKRFGIPTFIIGMTVVAMGTSAPECAVSITASLKGANGMAISNVIGSNIFNLLVVCGCCALFEPLLIKKETLKKEFPFSILAAVILGVMGFFGRKMGHIDGIIMLVLFVLFLIWMVNSAKDAMDEGRSSEVRLKEEEYQTLSTWRVLLYIIGGIVVIVIGGQLVVNCAETIALALGMSDNLVGLTVCSIGTSLPELITSIVAAKKKQAGMALGNVIGSNIFNIMLVAGAASAISPIGVSANNLIDIVILIFVSLYIMAIVWKKQHLTRAGGISILAIYALYMVYICLREMTHLF